MLHQKNNTSRTLISVFVCLLLVLGSIYILLFRQNIVDMITVWRFQPSEKIVSLVGRVNFSKDGTFLFYASQPELQTSHDFNGVCYSIENTSSILGCYSNYRIFIYDVKDEKLDGIKEVTAAHEMLHAVFQRLGVAEKDRLSILLENEYNKMVDNKEFVDLIQFYERTEPGERTNELHSIVGTMIRDISPELEEHYAKYFISRELIVDYYDKYNGVFKALTEKANQLSSQLSQLAINIPAKSEQYNSSVQKLNADIKAFNIRATNNDFTSQYQFYNERSVLESRVVSVNNMKEDINNDINKYNEILKEYNSITAESKKLYNSIDSTLVEAPSVD